MRILAFALLGLLPLAATAQDTPMTAAEFEAYVTGKTLTFGTNGTPFGIEQYKPGRQVLWAFVGQECQRGVWYDEGDQICFVYEHEPTPQCWSFFRTEDGLRARFEDGTPDSTELTEVEQAETPLICAGPDVGV